MKKKYHSPLMLNEIYMQHYLKTQEFFKNNSKLLKQIDKISKNIKIIDIEDITNYYLDKVCDYKSGELILNEVLNNYLFLVNRYICPISHLDDNYLLKEIKNNPSENFYIWIHKDNIKHIPLFYKYLKDHKYINEEFIMAGEDYIVPYYSFILRADR